MRNAKIFLASLLALGASACSFSESKFEKKASEASCEWTVECFEGVFADVDACLEADSEMSDTDSCEYDSKAAKDCVDAIEELTCDDTGLPSVCNDVYTNCGSSSNNTSNTANNMSNNTSM